MGQTVLAALAESGLTGRRVANVVSWFVVAQLPLGQEASRVVTPAPAAEASTITNAPVRREELTSPAAGQLWEMLHRLQPAPEPGGPALLRSHPPPLSIR